MIQQLSKSLVFECFFTASKIGKTGLTVTIDIYNNAGTLVVTAGSATAIGGGYYSYTLSSGSVVAAGNYRAIFKTTDTTVDQQHIPSLWTAGEDWVQNLDTNVASRNSVAPDNTSIATILTRTDVATSTRNATTPPTVAAIRTEIDSNSTKLDAAVSTRASATDYTTARAAKLDNLDAAMTTRATPAQILQTPANLIKTNASNQVEASSVQGSVTGSVASVTAGVTVTTNNDKTGHVLSPGGVQAISTDVWSESLPGVFTTGQAGSFLPRLGTVQVTVVSPVASDGELSLKRGADYAASEGRAIEFINFEGSWVDLTASTPYLYVYRAELFLFSVAGTVINPVGANQQVNFDLLRVNTLKLQVDDQFCNYVVWVTLPGNSHEIPLAGDRVLVS